MDKIDAERFRGSFSGQEADVLFLNPGGGGRFLEAAFPSGISERLDGRAVVPFDMDGDGRLDLAIRTLQGLRVYRNAVVNGNHFIQLDVQAAKNKPIYGAVVKVTTKSRTVIDRLRLTTSFHSQVLPRLHFGLSGETSVQKIEVMWPWGERSVYGPLAADRRYRIAPGSTRAIPVGMPSWKPEERPQARPRITTATMVEDLNGAAVPMAPATKPAVVNLWAPWCAACKTEAPHLRALHEKNAAWLSVIGMSIETKDQAKNKAFIAEQKLDFPQRIATEAVVRSLFASGQIRLPTTLFFDASGQLVRRFGRILSPQELEGLLKPLRIKTSAEDWTWVAELDTQEGDSLASYRSLKKAARMAPKSAILLTRIAYAADQVGLWKEALIMARQATEAEPKSELGWRALRRLVAKYKGAAAAMEALKPAPNTADILMIRSALAELLKQDDLALKYARAAAELKPGAKDIQERISWFLDPSKRELPIRHNIPTPVLPSGNGSEAR